MRATLRVLTCPKSYVVCHVQSMKERKCLYDKRAIYSWDEETVGSGVVTIQCTTLCVLYCTSLALWFIELIKLLLKTFFCLLKSSCINSQDSSFIHLNLTMLLNMEPTPGELSLAQRQETRNIAELALRKTCLTAQVKLTKWWWGKKKKILKTFISNCSVFE